MSSPQVHTLRVAEVALLRAFERTHLAYSQDWHSSKQYSLLTSPYGNSAYSTPLGDDSLIPQSVSGIAEKGLDPRTPLAFHIAW